MQQITVTLGERPFLFLVYSNNLRWSQKYYFDNEFTTEGLSKRGKGERKLNNDYNMLLDNMIKYNNTFARQA